ncbi:UNKNOWN [Stylonychia lemnae]|uniref:Homeobox domain-containing protein n=1 Tax=Stylonychia lemnae TaxID=5949 RepID=A0A078A5B7_STYLE|nr:UNKNOWN [Stylonychia lemnae]|eukprot:CDW75949.1 UNKNOWN [Stylonychia lemnae]
MQSQVNHIQIDQIQQQFIEEQEDLDKIYDNYFISSRCDSKFPQIQQLNGDIEKQFEDQWLYSLLQNHLLYQSQTKSSNSKKHNTTTFIYESNVENCSSSLNEGNQTNPTEEKGAILKDGNSGCLQNELNLNRSKVSENDLERTILKQQFRKQNSNNNRRIQKQSHRVSIKSKEQYQYLESQFIKNQRWSNERILEISQQIGLSFSKVYKWNWDRRMALKQYHEQGKYCDSRYIKIFEVEKCSKNKQGSDSKEIRHSSEYRVFNIQRI